MDKNNLRNHPIVIEFDIDDHIPIAHEIDNSQLTLTGIHQIKDKWLATYTS